jgi:hypothetical protein
MGELATAPGEGCYDFPSAENGWHGYMRTGMGAEWQIFEVD